jgi:methionyl aminopeptidase
VTIKTPEELALMREAGRIVARAHEAMREWIRPGVSTLKLDQIAEEVIRDHGAIPAFLGYPKVDAPNFPGTITASINQELVHGIPSKDRILREGDIISLDTGCHYQGYVGDAARTWPVGEIPPPVQRLLDAAEESLRQAIAASVAGNRVSDIAQATQTCAERYGYSVAREYTGHGIGQQMHEAPQVPNWWPRKNSPRLEQANVVLRPGMTLAIEPMIIAGRPATRELGDQWTVVTKDKSLCAHVEHTIAITDGEPLILTVL